MKLLILLAVALMAINIYLFTVYPPYTDSQWCQDNGGRWINAAYNNHCQLPHNK